MVLIIIKVCFLILPMYNRHKSVNLHKQSSFAEYMIIKFVNHQNLIIYFYYLQHHIHDRDCTSKLKQETSKIIVESKFKYIHTWMALLDLLQISSKYQELHLDAREHLKRNFNKIKIKLEAPFCNYSLPVLLNLR